MKYSRQKQSQVLSWTCKKVIVHPKSSVDPGDEGLILPDGAPRQEGVRELQPLELLRILQLAAELRHRERGNGTFGSQRCRGHEVDGWPYGKGGPSGPHWSTFTPTGLEGAVFPPVLSERLSEPKRYALRPHAENDALCRGESPSWTRGGGRGSDSGGSP